MSRPEVDKLFLLSWYKYNCGFRLNFKSLSLGSNTSLLIKIGTVTINIFCQLEMFVYSCSIKICVLKFSELLESIFCLMPVVEALSLQKGIDQDG